MTLAVSCRARALNPRSPCVCECARGVPRINERKNITVIVSFMDDDDTDAYQREKSFCDLARCFFFTRADFEGTKLATVTKKVIETTPQISLVQNNSVCLWSVFFLFRFWSEIVFRVVVLF